MTVKKNGGKARREGLAPLHKAVPILLTALAVFIGICFIIPKGTGVVGGAVSNILLGLFSVGAYFIPPVMLLHAALYIFDVKNKKLILRPILSLVLILAVSMFTYAVTSFGVVRAFNMSEFYEGGAVYDGGGALGGLLAYPIAALVDNIGVIIVSSAIFALYIVYTASSGKSLREAGRAIIYGILTIFVVIERGFKKIFGISRTDKKKLNAEAERIDEITDDEFFSVDNGLERLEISDLGIVESRDRESIEANPTLHEQVYHRSAANEDGSPASETHGRVIDMEFEVDDKPSENIVVEDKPQYEDITLHDSADSIFTKDFNPYDIAIAEEMANKPSSRAETVRTSPTVTETIDDITEEMLERRRREEAFERARRRAFENQGRVATPVTNSGEYEGKPKTVEYHVHEAESLAREEVLAPESVTVTIEKGREDGEFKPYRVPETETPTTPVYDVTSDVRETVGGITVERTPIVEETASHFTLQKPETVEEDPDFHIEERIHSIMESDDEEEFEETPDEVEEDDFDVEEIPPEEQNPYVIGARERFDFFREETDMEEVKPETILREEAQPIIEDDFDDTEEDEPPFEYTQSESPREPARVAPTVTSEPPKTTPKRKDEFAGYKMPPIDLLNLPEVGDNDKEDEEREISEYARIIVETLASFNVTASISGVARGPRITRYEVVPAHGVRVNQITSLFNDVVLALAVEGIRMEAPIPGKAAIGFEIPNKKFCTVTLRELLETQTYRDAKSSTFVCVGKDVAGVPVFGEIEKYPHALIAGATNMGKSVCINSIILSMLYHARPDELRFILIDPKKVEFKIYSGIPHLLVPVVTEAKQAAGALMWAVDEMERRFDLMEQHNAKNIKDYNAIVKDNPEIGTPFAKVIIVIDELNDLMMQVRDPVEGLIMRLAQKARAAGIHLIIGTQRPDVKVITGTIKANITARMSCKVTSQVDSRTILETVGAEKLLPYGDILYKPPERTSPLRVQGAFVSTPEVEAVVEFIKAQSSGDHYDDEVLAEINRAAQKCGNKKSSVSDDDMDDDEGLDGSYYGDQQFLDAVDIAIRAQKVSTSLLIRKMRIGFQKAARFIDQMEDIGIVSEPDGQRPRSVLITMDEWREKLSRVEID